MIAADGTFSAGPCASGSSPTRKRKTGLSPAASADSARDATPDPASNFPYVLWVVPLLVENSLYKKANECWWWMSAQKRNLSAPCSARCNSRACRTNPCCSGNARSPLAVADDVIDNNGAPDAIASELPACTHTICSLRRSLSHRKTVMQTQVLFEHPLNEKMRTWCALSF